MRVLVTGASGFLGRHLTRALKQEGHVVIGLIRDVVSPMVADPELLQALAPAGDAFVYGGFDSVERALSEYEIDSVIHLAAQTQVSTAAADPTGTLEANVRGTWQVLEASRRQKVKRVIVASSDKAYGDGMVPYQEDQGLRPHGIYATSKACADMITQAYAKEYFKDGLRVVITRCGNLYGPGHLNWSTLIPGTIKSVLAGEAPRLRSNGGPKRDFLFVEDAVAGYLKLLRHMTGLVTAFNFGSGAPVGVSEVVATILRTVGREDLAPTILDLKADGQGGIEIDEQWVDARRATQLLAWAPAHSLERGLAKTIAWYRAYFRATAEPTMADLMEGARRG